MVLPVSRVSRYAILCQGNDFGPKESTHRSLDLAQQLVSLKEHVWIIGLLRVKQVVVFLRATVILVDQMVGTKALYSPLCQLIHTMLHELHCTFDMIFAYYPVIQSPDIM